MLESQIVTRDVKNMPVARTQANEKKKDHRKSKIAKKKETGGI